MFDEGAVERNLILRQASFFMAAAERGYTVTTISARTGIGTSTLNSYVDKPSRKASLMPLSAFIKFGAKLPALADLLSMLIEDSGHDLVAHDPAATNWLALANRTAAFASHVCLAAADGKIDHREDLDLRAEIQQIISEGQGVVAR